MNLAITTNARGGPGIVLASVAFEAGIISPQFYTTLVLAAVLTSQIAGDLAGLRVAQRLAIAQPLRPTPAQPRLLAGKRLRRLTLPHSRSGLLRYALAEALGITLGFFANISYCLKKSEGLRERSSYGLRNCRALHWN